MKKLIQMTFIAATLATTGCATIMSESKYPVSIQSQPSGASFVIKNRAGETISNGITPQTIVLKSGAGYFKGEIYQITFNKKGFPTKTVELKADVNGGWYIAGNLVFAGLVGWFIVDPATGAMYKLPEKVDANLSEKSQTLKVMLIDNLDDNQRSQLVRLN
ncbi:MAG: hypothetical protein Q4A81_07200 [Pasteurellaceae bacterium]|nr:hypothetical protein [Pasteurellaceae bacterium]